MGMLTCQSPLRVMRVAHHLAGLFLTPYASRFSRHDFTLPQLFACLVLKAHQKCSYRRAEALLRDSPLWLAALGMSKAPDHNTLCRAAQFLLKNAGLQDFLDAVARWALKARILGLSKKPAVVDTTHLEPRPVSRYYERQTSRWASLRRRRKKPGRQRKARSRRAYHRRIARTIRRLPKLALLASGTSHLILAARSATGVSADAPFFTPLLKDLRKRVPHRHLKVAADPGFDSHANHVEAREQLQIRALIPCEAGYQAIDPAHRATSPYRRRMQWQLATKDRRKRCGYSQRAQAETVHSMIKRNLGAATAGKTAWSRKRDLHLKVITHNVMIA